MFETGIKAILKDTTMKDRQHQITFIFKYKLKFIATKIKELCT